MDITIRENDISFVQVGLYASVSFIVVSVMGAVIYTTFSRKYRLNWFEKTLLETAKESADVEKRWVIHISRYCITIK